MQTSEPSIRIGLLVNRYIDLGTTKLLHHFVEISNAEVDHPVLVSIAEIVGVVRERGEDSRTGLLRPRFLDVVGWHEIDAEIFLVPLADRGRIFRAEE